MFLESVQTGNVSPVSGGKLSLFDCKNQLAASLQESAEADRNFAFFSKTLRQLLSLDSLMVREIEQVRAQLIFAIEIGRAEGVFAVGNWAHESFLGLNC